MKKIVFLLLVSSLAFSQNVMKKETVTKFLLKTWTADYAMMNGMKIEKMGDMKKLVFTFKNDNTFILNDGKTGTWKFNGKAKNIELYQEGTLRSTIVTLQSKTFVMTLVGDKTAPKGIKDFQIFFKAKG